MPETYDKLPVTPINTRKSSDFVKTGGWRTYMPKMDHTNCIRCNICWKFCPDVAISLDEEGWPVINYDQCKGCGICANECPKECIEMEREESL